MKIENQTCSVELSKDLQKLGIIQDSLFYHFPNPNTKEIQKKLKLKPYTILSGNDYIGKNNLNLKKLTLSGVFQNTYSAFNVAELFIMLGDNFISWSFNKKGKKWIATVINKNERPDGKNITTANEFDRYSNTQANAMATLLIATIKVGYLKVDDINKRLLNA